MDDKLEEILGREDLSEEERLDLEAYDLCKGHGTNAAKLRRKNRQSVIYTWKKYGLKPQGTPQRVIPLEKKFEVLALTRGSKLSRKTVSLKTGIIPRVVNKYNQEYRENKEEWIVKAHPIYRGKYWEVAEHLDEHYYVIFSVWKNHGLSIEEPESENVGVFRVK